MNVPGRKQKEASSSGESRLNAAARKAQLEEDRRRKRQTLGLGIFLGIVGIALVALLLSVWPAAEKASKEPETQAQSSQGQAEAPEEGQQQQPAEEQAEPTVEMSLLGLTEVDVTGGTAILILVAVLGGLGSFIHAGTSFVEYVGNEQLGRSWTWWYVLRVPIGASLALILYIAFRGGLFSTSATSGVVNIYGVGALAALAGLFSKQATNKLEDVFSALFRVPDGKGDDRLKDSLANPRPTVTATEPARLIEGAETTLAVRGTGFAEKAQARLRRLATDEVLEAKSEYVDDTQLRVVLAAADLAEAARRGKLEVVVVNPPPGGGASDPILVDIDPPGGGGGATVEPPETPDPAATPDLPTTPDPPTSPDAPTTPEPPPGVEPEAGSEADAEAAAAAEFAEPPPPPPDPDAPPADEPPARGG